jgi:hypothetical protein
VSVLPSKSGDEVGCCLPTCDDPDSQSSDAEDSVPVLGVDSGSSPSLLLFAMLTSEQSHPGAGVLSDFLGAPRIVGWFKLGIHEASPHT